MKSILNTVVDALKADEAQGKMALESMVDLTKTHPSCWRETSSDLIEVMAEVCLSGFVDGTRS